MANKYLITILLTISMLNISYAKTYRVGPGTGYDYQTITEALLIAQKGDTVLVADGNYTTSKGELFPLEIKDGITLKRETPDIMPVINGENVRDNIIYICNFMPPVEPILIEGFKITGGYNDRKLGGAIYIERTGDIEIRNCIITGNYEAALGFGAGIYCSGVQNMNLKLVNCLITHNISYGQWEHYGAGLASLSCNITMLNCTVSKNICSGNYCYGGGISLLGGSAVIKNSIIWNNYPNDIYASGFSPKIEYSDINASLSGVGNIDADPCFVDLNNDFHLKGNSPCIDAGTNENAPGNDLDGRVRPNPDTSIVDMGCYEFYGKNPHILMAGYMNTRISSSIGGTFQMLAWAKGYNGMSIDNIEIYYQGNPTGAFLLPVDPSNGIFGIPQTDIQAGLPSNSFLFELQAKSATRLSSLWPYLTTK